MTEQRVESKPELELILLITSPDPESVITRVANKGSIGDYKLTAEPARILHDIYLDTPDHHLGSKRINLRVRGSGRSFWITMKVSPGLLTMRRHERLEIEIPWSSESLSQIVGIVAGKGVRLIAPSSLDPTMSQVDVMKRMGLQVLQDRKTERVPRNVLENDGQGEVLAELDIDSVLYHFPAREVRLFELELEAKSPKGRKILRDLNNKLLRDFAPELRPWRYGKLVTGEKIERLLRKGDLDNFIDGSRLKPEGYERVERA